MKKVSLYIHIPFCKQKCMYCDFPSFCGKDTLMERYIDALIKEIKEKASKYYISTIFVGGGTPTYLHLNELEKLLNSVNALNLSKDIEFTVECNPGTLTEEKLSLMKNKGVNRLSIGLQAYQEDLLKRIGRIHSFKEFKENYLLARRIGFKNINIDLMFGLPNQKVEQWKETLEEVLLLQPEHISAYSLIIEEGTTFYKLYESNKLPLPSEEDEREMYRITLQALKNKGYHQYEISNFSNLGKECKHNIVYWDLKEYLGCGSAAASYIGGTRYKNLEGIEDYIRAIEGGEKTFDEMTVNTKEDEMEEFMFMGLRKTQGISEEKFYRRFGVNVENVYGTVINKHIAEGLLIKNSGKIYLSNKGIELSNYVMSDFILTL